MVLRALLASHYLGAGMRIRPPIFPVRRDQLCPFLFISPSRLCRLPSRHALAKIAAPLQVEFAIERLPNLSCMSKKVWASAHELYCRLPDSIWTIFCDVRREIDTTFDSLKFSERLQSSLSIILHFPISIYPSNDLNSIKGSQITLASAQVQCISVLELASFMGTDEEHPWSSVGNTLKIKVLCRIGRWILE
jgi:hypothetical protein